MYQRTLITSIYLHIPFHIYTRRRTQYASHYRDHTDILFIICIFFSKDIACLSKHTLKKQNVQFLQNRGFFFFLVQLMQFLGH